MIISKIQVNDKTDPRPISYAFLAQSGSWEWDPDMSMHLSSDWISLFKRSTKMDNVHKICSL